MASYSPISVIPPSAHERSGYHSSSAGFTLLEVLVSLVVLVIAGIGAIAGFNLITQSVIGSDIRANQSRLIDEDIAEISRLSEVYNACVDPAGSISTNCPGQQVGNSFYYFPDPVTPANVNTFFLACRSTTAAGHITQNFITAINALGQPAGDVTREAAIRVEPTDAANHLVRITWVDPTRNNRELRRLEITPVVSAWCP